MTMQEYERVYYPGARVTLTLSNGTILHGIAGNLWSGKGKQMVVKFKDGSMVEVTENLVGCIEVEKVS